MANSFCPCTRITAAAALALLALTSCVSRPPVLAQDAPYFGWLQSVSPNLDLTGKVYFWPAPAGDGIKVQVILTGAEPHRNYNVQIHENGTCADQGRAAKKVFDPAPSFLRIFSAPAGKLGKFKANADGAGFFETFSKKISFEKSVGNIAGRSILVHASGKTPVACAVIPVPAKEKG